MRILHTADWHFGRALEGRSRMEEQSAFMDELVQIVEDERIDLILIAGDVYDSVNPPAWAEQLFYEGVARLAAGGQRQVVVIAGNHDQPERLAASSPLAAAQGITLLGLPSSQLVTVAAAKTGELARIAALPYPSEARLKELLSEETDEASLRNHYSARVGQLIRRMASGFAADSVNVIMSHVYVLGGSETESERPIQVGGAYTVDTAALTAGAQYVALGHLHRPQLVKAPMPIRYAGSPLAYSFSEAGQAKSVTVLELAPGEEARPREIFLRSGRPLVSWKASEGLQQVHRWLDEGRDLAAWIDLEIVMTEAMSLEQIQALRRARSGFIHIRPVFTEAAEIGELTAMSSLPMDELFARFYARRTGGAVPEPELVRLFLELLQETAAQDAAAE